MNWSMYQGERVDQYWCHIVIFYKMVWFKTLWCVSKLIFYRVDFGFKVINWNNLPTMDLKRVEEVKNKLAQWYHANQQLNSPWKHQPTRFWMKTYMIQLYWAGSFLRSSCWFENKTRRALYYPVWKKDISGHEILGRERKSFNHERKISWPRCNFTAEILCRKLSDSVQWIIAMIRKRKITWRVRNYRRETVERQCQRRTPGK
jgi:hypothetical protein